MLKPCDICLPLYAGLVNFKQSLLLPCLSIVIPAALRKVHEVLCETSGPQRCLEKEDVVPAAQDTGAARF